MSSGPTLGNSVKKGGGFFLVLGVLVLLLGIGSMSAPMITGIALTLLIGTMLLISGLFQVLHGCQFPGKGARICAILVGVLTVIVGGLILARPVSALAGLTLILACFFLADGIFTAITAFQAKPNRGWGWLLFSAVVTFLLGAIIWKQWPLSGAWAFGVLIGIRIFLAGLTMILMGSAFRFMGSELESAEKSAGLEAAGDVMEADSEEIGRD